MYKGDMYLIKYNFLNNFFIFIVIKERDIIIDEIKEKIYKIWNAKLYLKSKINNQKEKNFLQKKTENKTQKNYYILNNSLDEFENNKIYITSFLKLLWEYPELIYEIINISDFDIIKNNLSSFFVNNFYTDYLSGNFIENNLLYVITLLLKNEFEKAENLNNIEDYLENTKLGIIFDDLGKIPEVQNFFKVIIINSIEKIERYNAMEEIEVDVDEISTKLTETKKGKKEDENNKFLNAYKKIVNDKMKNRNIINMKRRNENYKIFVEKYILDIKLSFIIEEKNEAKKNNKEELYIFLSKLEEELKSSNNEDLYSNKILMENFLKTSSPPYILSFYQNEFLKGIDFINQLLSDFEKNIILMPKFIKCICKIISLLIKNKFKNSTKADEYFFISKFIIDKLLIYFLSSPNFKALINHFIISESTIRNIQEAIIVLKKLFSLKLFKNNFEECNYTPYNKYILEKFENICNILENSKKIKLPNFIQDLVENKLQSDFLYDYFKENKEKIFKNISICFSVENILALINSIKNIKNFFDNIGSNDKKIKLKKVFDKLLYKDNLELIKKVNEDRIENFIKEVKERNKIKNKDKKNIKNYSYKIENYYLLNIQIIEQKYEIIFSINNDKNKYFFIDIKDKNKKELTEKATNLINLKNSLIGILGIYRPLDISDYYFDESSNFIEIISEIKKFINFPNFTLSYDNYINTTNWSISSLFDNIDKIPNEYIIDDYDKLFNELGAEIKESIEELNLEKISVMNNKLIFVNKALNYYEEKSRDIKDIIINESIKIVTEKIALLIDIKFIYNDNEKIFYLNKSNLKNSNFEGNIQYNKKNECYTLKTMETFAKFFPNLTNYHFSMDISPLEIIKELGINKKLKEYFDMIKKLLTFNSIIEKNQYNDLYQEKIINNFFDKIYEKIYPPIPDPNDSKILKIMRKMPKKEIDNIINKKYNLENLIPEVTDLFKKIHNSRTPLSKLNSLKNILNYITNIIGYQKRVKNNSIGADDIIPALNYFIICAQPYMIITDIDFIKTFKYILPPCENEIVIFESIINKILTNYDTEK